MKNEHCISICNRLLRGEQSAVGAYAKAIANYKDEPAPAELRTILDEHRQAVLTLTENIRSMGGTPAEDSGAWGAFAGAVQGTANALGHGLALQSLEAGEKAGRSDYESALDDKEVMTDCKELIKSTLLPATHSHIETLEALAAAH